MKTKLKSEEIALKKKLIDIYYSLEGYLKYKYFKNYESDELNMEILEDLEKYVKVKKRLFYSMIFWNTFNILALRYIMNSLYTHYILKFVIYSIFIIPNFWFYQRKFKSNRIDMQKLFILDYLNKQRIENKALNQEKFQINVNDEKFRNNTKIEISNPIINSPLEEQNELEKFLEDYYNNAIYGVFFNLKI